MTQEEAIKIVRNIYQTDAEKEALATLIPELAESEDERIRKEIIHYILYKANGVSEEQEHAWISYLEKQKEIPMPDSTELIEMWHNAKAMLKEKDFRDDAWRLAQNSFMVGFARGTCVKTKKQEEQKPAEWSEEDENMLWNIISIVGESKSIQADEMLDWLKSLRPQSHWKPTKAMLDALNWARSEFHPDCADTMDDLTYLYKELNQLYYDGN